MYRRSEISRLFGQNLKNFKHLRNGCLKKKIIETWNFIDRNFTKSKKIKNNPNINYSNTFLLIARVHKLVNHFLHPSCLKQISSTCISRSWKIANTSLNNIWSVSNLLIYIIYYNCINWWIFKFFIILFKIAFINVRILSLATCIRLKTRVRNTVYPRLT